MSSTAAEPCTNVVGMERTATCHCGQLRVIATGEPARVYLCHCKACQRQSGSVVHSGASWLKNQVRIEGEHQDLRP